MIRKVILLVAAALVAASYFGDRKIASKSNFQSVIEAFVSNSPGLCILMPMHREMPFKVMKAGDPWELVAADAFTDAGLLSKQEIFVPDLYLPLSQTNVNAPGFEYELTEEGKKFFKWGGFCSGHLRILSVDNYTKPAETRGKTMTEVDYQFMSEGLANWLRSPQILSAYPGMEKYLRGEPQKAQVSLSLTAKGWIPVSAWGAPTSSNDLKLGR